MNIKHLRLRDGTVRALVPGELIPDGATLIVPAFLRDHDDPDGERATAHEARRADIEGAWRHPSQPEPSVEPAATREEAHRAMVARLASAWNAPIATKEPTR